MRVFVLDKYKQPLMPCSCARARELLKKEKAAIFRFYPFTIILFDRKGGDCQKVELKLDPGSKISGFSLVATFQHKMLLVVWAANLKHRGQIIKKAMDSRRALRRSRRARTIHYRSARFDNRIRKKGWFPPSIQSRIDNIENWTKKLCLLVPIGQIAIEIARFDTQKMQNPEISGIEYQQGTLMGYEVREYLLEKWQRQCAYCHKREVRLEIDHILPKSLGGTNSVSNLVIACHSCNKKKEDQSVQKFLEDKPVVLKRILEKKNIALKDAAAVNTTRTAIGQTLLKIGIPVLFFNGAQTKFNRHRKQLPKDHYLDACCVGDFGSQINIPKLFNVLEIIAMGRGSRQKCRVDRFGFPRTKAKSQKRIQGFQTGDLISAIVPTGKLAGTYMGRVAIRTSGSFNIKTDTQIVQGIHVKYCHLLHKVDGYIYNNLKQERDFLPMAKARDLHPVN